MKKSAPWILLGLSVLWILCSWPWTQGKDSEEFGTLPALHNGRVKPMDTIARTSLLILRGKQYVPIGERRASAQEWLLDMAARPDRSDTYKVFVIEDPDVLGLMRREPGREKYYSFQDLEPFLAEIRGQGLQAGHIEAPSRSRFQAAIVHLDQRLILYQRLKNSLGVSGTLNFLQELDQYLESLPMGLKAVEAHQASKVYDPKALAMITEFFRRYRFIKEIAYFQPLPPLPQDRPEHWASMGAGLLEAMRLGRLRPGIRDYAGMLDAWRNSDMETFRPALKAYKNWLKSHAPQPTFWAEYESRWNSFAPFHKGAVLYIIAFILSSLSWLVRLPALSRAAFLQLCLAFAVHTFGLVSRMVLQGRPPVTNLYSSAVFVGWVAVALSLILERMHRKGIATAVASIVGLMTLIIAHHLSLSGDTLEMMQAVLDSNFWLSTHVVAITIGYASTFLAGALAHVYLVRRAFFPSFHKSNAKELAQMAYGVICFSLLFSFVGTVLGGIWADQSWGRFWGWDPKENGALMIVLWNAIILHARWGGMIRELGLMVMAVFGNIVTSFSWFGVNMLGIGLHSYGWTDKTFSWLILFILSQIAVMALSALRLRSYSHSHSLL